MKIEAKEIISVGIPSKGPLYEGSVSLLEKAGLNYTKTERQYFTRSLFYQDTFEGEILGLTNLIFMRPKDIVKRVFNGDLDLGIVGTDTIAELALPVRYLGDLGFGKCRLAVVTLKSFSPPQIWRIGTSYPRIAQEYFDKKGIQISIQEQEGAVEGMLKIGWVDAIVELVESGTTRDENFIIEREEIGRYQAGLIASPEAVKGSDRFFDALVSRLLGAAKL